MSDNTQALSGRALSRARRQALTKGKGAKIDYAAAAQSTSAPVKSSTPERSEQSFAPTSRQRSFDVNPQQQVLSAGRKASIERRKQQVKGKTSSSGSQPTRQPRKKAVEPVVDNATTETVASHERSFAPQTTAATNRAKVNPVKSSAASQPKGRMIARSYRKAACEGKAKLQAKMSQNSALTCIATSADPNASCREIARQVREQRATQGKVKATSSARPTGRMSKKSESSSPSKVGFAKTSYEQEVSGTLVSNTNKMTGSEAGNCRIISGTEYTGPDEYQAKCSIKPEPNPRKVAVTNTAAGRTVSGTEVGLSESVTGTEPGQCRYVTGTEYLPADQGELFCGTKMPEGTPKVSQSKTARNQIISGPSMQQRSGMTGLESNEERQITGSQYVSSHAPVKREPTRQARNTVMSAAPTKVDVSHTGSGATVSGTNVNFNSPVTGNDAGYCSRVSGMGYQSQETRAEKCGDQLDPAPQKSVESHNFSGQRITGDRAGIAGRVTGAEAGVCKSVTGSSYLSSDAVQSCGVKDAKALKPDLGSKYNQTAKPATGVQPGPLGLTGAQKGVCQSVSGTPYQGTDQVSAMCQVSGPAMEGDSDFPVMMNQPMAMHAQVPNPGYVPPLSAQNQIQVGSEELNEFDKVTSKITGEGADSGYAITGDSWGRDGKVSGTEGRWSNGRNVSIPGGRSAMNTGARDFRPEANPKVSESPITGSSGNTTSGASVTVSGGARA